MRKILADIIIIIADCSNVYCLLRLGSLKFQFPSPPSRHSILLQSGNLEYEEKSVAQKLCKVFFSVFTFNVNEFMRMIVVKC